MKRPIALLALCAATFSLLTATAPAQTLFTYSFSDVTASSGLTSAGGVAGGITFGSFSATGTPSNPNASGRFSFTGWSLGGINTSEYYEMTISLQPGFSLDLDGVTFTIQRSATGIRNYCVRSSMDGFGANIMASIDPANAGLSVVGVPDANTFEIADIATANVGSRLSFDSAFDAITSPLTLRFYGFTAESSAGTFSLDDVAFLGAGTAPRLTWNPPGSIWNNTDVNWLDGTVSVAFASGSDAIFDDAGLAAGAAVNVDPAGVSPGNVTVANTAGSYIFSGGAIGGSGMLTKIGAGTLILQTTYANAISVQAGTLITQGVNLLSDVAALSIGTGAAVELDAGGETVGPLELTGGRLTANGTVTLGGNVAVNASATSSRIEGTLALGGSNRTITLAGGAVLELDATVAGNVRLALVGNGRVNLNADNAATYSGNVQVNPGVTLSLAGPGALGSAQLFANGGTITSPANATPLVIPNAVSIGGHLVFDAARDIEFQGSWTFFNGVIPGIKMLTINNTTRITGTIMGSGAGSALLVGGSGKLIVGAGNHSFQSLTVDGTDGVGLEWNGSSFTTPVIEMLAGARLNGEGAMGGLIVVGGVVAPGTAADPTGVFYSAGLSAFSGAFEFDLGGTLSGESDQLDIVGAVVLAGDLTVTLVEGFSPQFDDVFTLIPNDGAGEDPVSGTFDGRPGGTIFMVGGDAFRIAYDGGDGNDVTLTVVPEPSAMMLVLVGTAMLRWRRR